MWTRLLTLAHAQRGLRYLVCPSVCVCVCVCLSTFILKLQVTKLAQPLEQLSLESCIAVNAISGAASLFQNRCIRYQGIIPHRYCFRSCVSQLLARAQLSQCAFVFITCLDACSTGSAPGAESCVAVNATSSAASLFQNRCTRYQGTVFAGV